VLVHPLFNAVDRDGCIGKDAGHYFLALLCSALVPFRREIVGLANSIPRRARDRSGTKYLPWAPRGVPRTSDPLSRIPRPIRKGYGLCFQALSATSLRLKSAD